jgi:hypothetical protein
LDVFAAQGGREDDPVDAGGEQRLHPFAFAVDVAARVEAPRRQTDTGWGTNTYWNAFVANLDHGRGSFDDDRLDEAKQLPIAARNRFATSATARI